MFEHIFPNSKILMFKFLFTHVNLTTDRTYTPAGHDIAAKICQSKTQDIVLNVGKWSPLSSDSVEDELAFFSKGYFLKKLSVNAF